MLSGAWVPQDSRSIDFTALPRLRAEHAVVSDVRDAGGTRVNQHNYLVWFRDRYWAMWSDGAGVPGMHGVVPGHDRAGQRVSFATSPDGLHWSAIGDLTGPPDEGYGWIARGFWLRGDKLLALASRYFAPGYAGPELSLHAFVLDKADPAAEWRHLGVLQDDSMNNFPPKRLRSGEWLMTRRDGNKAVHMLRGGVTNFDQWTSYPVIGYEEGDLAAEEPYWWALPDGRLAALFRDNRHSGFLFRAFSEDLGRTWTRPEQTNFPDAASKFCATQLADGRYVLVSNSNPGRRDPLTLAISDDGLHFDRLLWLAGGRHVDYPFVMEHDGHVFVAFAGAKQTVEVLRIRVGDLPAVQPPSGS